MVSINDKELKSCLSQPEKYIFTKKVGQVV